MTRREFIGSAAAMAASSFAKATEDKSAATHNTAREPRRSVRGGGGHAASIGGRYFSPIHSHTLPSRYISYCQRMMRGYNPQHSVIAACAIYLDAARICNKMRFKSLKKFDYFKFCGILTNPYRLFSAEICDRVLSPILAELS